MDLPAPGQGWRSDSVEEYGDGWLLVYDKPVVSSGDCDAYFARFAGWTEQTRSPGAAGVVAFFNDGVWMAVVSCSQVSGITVQLTPYE